MATALLSPSAKQQFLTDAGEPAAGYALYTYAANTTTEQATFTNRAGTVPNSNPIILDARGEAIIYLTPGVVYDYVLKTAPDPVGSLVWTREDVIATAGDANAVSFQQRGTGAIQRSSQEKMRERYTALDIIPEALHEDIAAGTSITNVASYIAQACDNADEIVLPPGRYYLLDGFVVPSGKRLRGSGKHKTILYVPDTFNMSADGVILLEDNTDPGAAVEDLSIIFEQPDTNVRADLNQYPPAIKANGAPRFAVRRVRIELAWDGIDMTGNNGGAVIEDFEISAFNIDIDIDGSLDSVKISKAHHWPFGLVIPSRPLLYTLYESSLHTGIKVGRCDDFHLSDSIFFSLATATNFYASGSGSAFGNIVNCDFDDRGGLNVSSAALTVNGCYFSVGKTDSVVANISGGSVAMNGCTVSMSALPLGGKAIVVSGASTQFTWSGGLYGSGSLDATAVSGDTGCRMNIQGVMFDRVTNTAYSMPTVNYSNAKGSFVSNTTGPKGSGAGSLVSVGGDLDVYIGPNIRSGWAYTLPAGALGLVKVDVGVNVLGVGFAVYSTNGSGVVTIPHGAPKRPLSAAVSVVGSGGAAHAQVAAFDDTNVSFYCTDMAGAAIASSPMTLSWQVFG